MTTFALALMQLHPHLAAARTLLIIVVNKLIRWRMVKPDIPAAFSPVSQIA
jgi:hypothetical protein